MAHETSCTPYNVLPMVVVNTFFTYTFLYPIVFFKTRLGKWHCNERMLHIIFSILDIFIDIFNQIYNETFLYIKQYQSCHPKNQFWFGFVGPSFHDIFFSFFECVGYHYRDLQRVLAKAVDWRFTVNDLYTWNIGWRSIRKICWPIRFWKQ